MTHLDEGTILALRDRGLVDADAREHVDECATCAAALTAAQERADAVAFALRSLDGGPPIDVDAAKAAVRRRLDARREERRTPAPGLYRSLGRAAALVLLASGAVYAMPNSPLRGWLSGDAGTDAAVVESPPPVEVASPEGVELTVPAGGLTIRLTSVQPDQRIEVVWVEGDRASVVAASDSYYAVSSSGVGVDVREGDVRIGLPTGPEPIIIEANGRMVLSRVDGAVRVQGDVVSRDPNGIVFTVGQG